MSAICVPNNCTGCSACTAVCSKHALSMLRTECGFYRPALDAEKCVDCGICGKVCPILNDQVESERILNTFMAKSRNATQRERSSSGGIFLDHYWDYAQQQLVDIQVKYYFQQNCSKHFR